MTDTTRWWWIRHAPVDSGGLIYGQEDLDCDCGQEEIFTGLACRLPAEALWVTSNLKRTHQTAEAVCCHLPPPPPSPLIEPRFAEQHFGEWQGLSHDALRERRAPEWHRFWHAPAHERPPGGESFDDLVRRTAEAIEEISERHAGRDIICFAHGGTIRAALSIALGGQNEAVLSFSIANCSLTRIDRIVGAAGSHAPDMPVAWRIGLVNFPPHGILSA